MIFIIIPIAFVTIGGSLMFAFAAIGGWRDLARRYPAEEKPEGEYYHFRSGSFSGIGYKNVLTVGVCDDGLYLAVFFLFRVAHPPLFLPWSEVTGGHVVRLFSWSACNVTIGPSERIRVTLPIEAMQFIHDKMGVEVQALDTPE
ncbi:hypothetical protein C5Y96_26465 [Blastopirellula marina]|uniref:Uncharacterized protein n=1 Tax=Blastopirellula marina TaxID=124 RepID=A0A2S8EYW0_9BACT|nr:MULTISPECIES: hypothetical protein [Pirellulaceae]PQO25051.1 hypothetical protein C5Y96_26465 [Blastopirellula marina]RCS40903.1 hypothetical protein DTL36_26515 [Bremerella cremea]